MMPQTQRGARSSCRIQDISTNHWSKSACNTWARARSCREGGTSPVRQGARTRATRSGRVAIGLMGEEAEASGDRRDP